MCAPSASRLLSGLYLSSTLESIVIPAGLLVTIATNSLFRLGPSYSGAAISGSVEFDANIWRRWYTSEQN